MKQSLMLAVAALILVTAGLTSTASEQAASSTREPDAKCRIPDPERPGQLMVNCPAFARRAVAVSKVEGDQVWLRYNLEGVPCGANYVVRFWPMGRHNGPYMDFEIGELPENGKRSDVVGPWRVPGVTAKKQYQYNVDLDVWKGGDAYRERSEDGFLGQCDRGGTLTLEPPRSEPPVVTGTTTPLKPAPCECHILHEERGRFTFKTVCQGDPGYGTHEPDVMVKPGRCETS